jgi:group I intron endonuclease
MKKFLVYEIKNNINGKSYIGQYSGLSFEKYFGSGKLIKLAIKKYGLENFTKTILEECSNKVELNEKEIFWIDKLETIENGYNLTEGGTGGDLSEFIKYDENWIENQRISTKKYWDNISDDERKLRSESVSGEKNGMYGRDGFWKGKKIPKEIVKKSLDNRRSYNKEQNPNWKGGLTYIYCECGKRIGYGHIYCNKCRPRSNDNNPFFGKQHSEETKNKLSEKRKGKKPTNMTQVVIDDIIYESLSEASRQTGIPPPTILWRIKSKNKKYENYQSHPTIKSPLNN